MSYYNNFTLINERRIVEINSLAKLYRHNQTGAEVMSLENDDENKVFGITFRTPPKDSTGSPHILEHSVLCGSRKYPVKEPFVELMKGSLNTFLNAFTFPDKTCYPVASQNLQDFYNLVDVYLDAVFFPRLSPYTLMQEGWHYEIDDVQSRLVYKGVVFNEMKGEYSNPESILDEESMFSLFPENEYRFHYGGDPSFIPNLSFDQFKLFHQTFYHPSNARIYFYGDDDPTKRLNIIHEYLSMFESLSVPSQINLQPAFSIPRRLDIPYDASVNKQEPKAFITLNWLLPETGDPELALGLTILEHVLIGTPASQLRKVLIDSGLGEDLVGRGLETGTRQMFFSTGLKGVKVDKIQAVEKLILDAISNIVSEGIDPANVASAMNTVEFRLRENNTGSFPRGLSIMLRSLDFWLHDKDPFAPLEFEKPLEAIKVKLQNREPYFEYLISTFLINNNHRTTVVLRPDPELNSRMNAAERERLDQARREMSDADIQQVVNDCQVLKLLQETPDTPDAIKTIPVLIRDDLDRKIRSTPSEVLTRQKTKILYHDLFTNGILYADIGFNLRTLPQEWIPYIPILSRGLIETGTSNENFVELLQRIGRTTGGIRPSMLTTAKRGSKEGIVWLFLRGKATVHQTKELFEIYRDIISSARLSDQERIRQIALEEKARLESRIVNGGHIIVNTYLRSRFNEADWAAEQMGGVSYLFFLRDLIQQIDTNWHNVQDKLYAIRDTLATGSNMLINITVDQKSYQSIHRILDEFISGLLDHEAKNPQWNLPNLPDSEGLIIPAQVNFVGKGADLYQQGYNLKGSIFVVTNHLNATWIWEKIRVQGGAYGGFAVFDNQSGVYSFLSYRDPNLKQSLETYDLTSHYLQTLNLGEEEITKAIIGTIGDLDAYQLPDAKGFTSLRYYLVGMSDEERQRLRDEVLATTLEDFHYHASIIETVKTHGVVTTLGSSDRIQSAGLFNEITTVL